MVDPIEDLIAAAPAQGQAHLRAIRALARRLCPAAEEVISYKLPALKQGRVFFYYAAFKGHIGIYPPLREDDVLLARLAPYRGPKGNLSFKYKDGVPIDLIAEVIKALEKAYATPKA
jgi:uncharacterized protein YdhG (YjbR/CyaY superfamily)